MRGLLAAEMIGNVRRGDCGIETVVMKRVVQTGGKKNDNTKQGGEKAMNGCGSKFVAEHPRS